MDQSSALSSTSPLTIEADELVCLDDLDLGLVLGDLCYDLGECDSLLELSSDIDFIEDPLDFFNVIYDNDTINTVDDIINNDTVRETQLSPIGFEVDLASKFLNEVSVTSSVESESEEVNRSCSNSKSPVELNNHVLPLSNSDQVPDVDSLPTTEITNLRKKSKEESNLKGEVESEHVFENPESKSNLGDASHTTLAHSSDRIDTDISSTDAIGQRTSPNGGADEETAMEDDEIVCIFESPERIDTEISSTDATCQRIPPNCEADEETDSEDEEIVCIFESGPGLIQTKENPTVIQTPDEKSVAAARRFINVIPINRYSSTYYECNNCSIIKYSGNRRRLVRHINVIHLKLLRKKKSGSPCDTLCISGRIYNSNELGSPVIQSDGTLITITETVKSTGSTSQIIVKVRPDRSTFLALMDTERSDAGVKSKSKDGINLHTGGQGQSSSCRPQEYRLWSDILCEHQNLIRTQVESERIISGPKKPRKPTKRRGNPTRTHGKTYRCGICQSNYISEACLTNHINEKHPKKPENIQARGRSNMPLPIKPKEMTLLQWTIPLEPIFNLSSLSAQMEIV